MSEREIDKLTREPKTSDQKEIAIQRMAQSIIELTGTERIFPKSVKYKTDIPADSQPIPDKEVKLKYFHAAADVEKARKGALRLNGKYILDVYGMLDGDNPERTYTIYQNPKDKAGTYWIKDFTTDGNSMTAWQYAQNKMEPEGYVQNEIYTLLKSIKIPNTVSERHSRSVDEQFYSIVDSYDVDKVKTRKSKFSFLKRSKKSQIEKETHGLNFDADESKQENPPTEQQSEQ